MPNLYIIAGCNGAGKTTASFTVFPEILDCEQFVNADNIAYGLSPFNVESVAVEAGRIMLRRIHELMTMGENFAIETTLATRSYVTLIQRAKQLGYSVSLIYMWLSTPNLAQQRVAERVRGGGHNIPAQVIIRRYFRGLSNLFTLFLPVCDLVVIADNSLNDLNIIARKENDEIVIKNADLWDAINKIRYESEGKK